MERTLQRQLFARRILWLAIGPDACKYFQFPWCEKASKILTRAELAAAGPEPPLPPPAPPAPPTPPPPGPPGPPSPVPPPPGPPYVPPPIYVEPWEPGPPHPPSPSPLKGWVSIYNDTKWIGYGTGDCTTVTCWDGEKWIQAINSPSIRLKAIGTWANGLRPTKTRFQLSDLGGEESFIKIRDNSYNVIGEVSESYEQLSEIPLDFTGTGDLYELYFEYNHKPPPTRTCTRIEFYFE